MLPPYHRFFYCGGDHRMHYDLKNGSYVTITYTEAGYMIATLRGVGTTMISRNCRIQWYNQNGTVMHQGKWVDFYYERPTVDVVDTEAMHRQLLVTSIRCEASDPSMSKRLLILNACLWRTTQRPTDVITKSRLQCLQTLIAVLGQQHPLPPHTLYLAMRADARHTPFMESIISGQVPYPQKICYTHT